MLQGKQGVTPSLSLPWGSFVSLRPLRVCSRADSRLAQELHRPSLCSQRACTCHASLSPLSKIKPQLLLSSMFPHLLCVSLLFLLHLMTLTRVQCPTLWGTLRVFYFWCHQHLQHLTPEPKEAFLHALLISPSGANSPCHGTEVLLTLAVPSPSPTTLFAPGAGRDCTVPTAGTLPGQGKT